tara:strand:+ start:175 stop:753 length:579 start_codon:yes stop_codon:yes gene_type:complete
MAIPILKRALAINSTNTSAVTCSVPSTTEPTGDGCFALDQNFRDPGGKRRLFVKPFGTNAAGKDFRVVVELFHVFREGQDAGNISTIYIPTTAAVLDCAQGNSKAAGDIGSPKLLDADDRFASVVASGGSITNIGAEVHAQATEAGNGQAPTKTSAAVVIDTLGATHVKFHFDLNGTAGGNSTGANCLWSLI